MYLHEYADADIPLKARCAALLERARKVAKGPAQLPVYAVSALVTEIVRHRDDLDARNTLVDAAYGNANAYLTRQAEHSLPADKILWCLEDLAECAKHPPARAIALLDAPARLAALGTGPAPSYDEWMDAVIVACDAYDPSDFHAVLTIADGLVPVDDHKRKGRIRDGRDLMYLEVVRNSGGLWGRPRADWFRREFGR